MARQPMGDPVQLIIAVSAAFMLAAAAPAPPPAPPVSATDSHGGTNVPGGARDPNRKVCKEEEETGSHFPTRICHTAAEWDEMTADAQKFTTRLQSSGSCGPLSCGH